MAEFQFELGDHVEDTLTGIKGRITARCEHFSGCIQYGVCPKPSKKDFMPDDFWLDEQRVKLLKRDPPASTRDTGGPQITPPSRYRR
jgi:hypothetical protein